ncbi:MAG: YhcH/YjgK/YiaL family protein [Bacteriovoracaceae bacterium]|jgi:YhcH/YjgK/YiaL family protein
MIFDRVENFKTYALGKHWERAFQFIQDQDISTVEQRYDLGDGMYASIESYGTKPPEKALFETHREYVDIQWTISGGETIYWHDASLLKIKKEYNAKRDVCFYESPDKLSLGLKNTSGYFCVFWPTDAHMPQAQLEGEARVKKGVVKIPLSLLKVLS